jgi:hypothetical protein
MVPDLPLPSDGIDDRIRVHDRVTGLATRYAARYGLFAYVVTLAATALAGAPVLAAYTDLAAATAAQVTLVLVAAGYLGAFGVLFRDRMPL